MWHLATLLFCLSHKAMVTMLISCLLFTFLICVPIISLAQRVVIKTNNITYEQLFDLIESQTGLRTFSSSNEINLDESITIKSNTYELEELLKEATGEAGLAYDLIDDYIVIRPLNKNEKNVDVASQQPDKKITISGKVTNERGEPIPFSTIRIKGTTFGTVSDSDGNYSLQFSKQDDVVLVISNLGFENMEKTYSGQSTINFTLKESIKGLNEVVVTGYQIISRERTSGSFQKVDAEQLDRKVSTNVRDKLQGMANGVLFATNGDVSIRGISSIYAERDPLVVLDGFPIQAGLNSINPNDIEDITVLKDAAAASIWGARSSNGVIVVRTKHGNSTGKPRIDVTAGFTFEKKPDLNSLPFASSASLLEVEQHMIKNNFITFVNARGIDKVFTAGQEVFSRTNGDDPIGDDLKRIKYLSGINNNEQFSSLFWRAQTKQQYNISISNRTNNSQYYLSLGYVDVNQYVKDNGENSYNLNLKYDLNLTDRIKISTSSFLNAKRSKQNGVDLDDYATLSQYQEIIDKDEQPIIQPMNYNQSQKEQLVEMGYPYNWDYNLLEDSKHRNNTADNLLLRMSAVFNYDIVKGLSFNVRYLKEIEHGNIRNVYNDASWYTRNLVNRYTSLNAATGVVVSPIPTGGFRKDVHVKNDSYTFRGQLLYCGVSADEKHDWTAIGGLETREEKSAIETSGTYGYNDQSLHTKPVDYQGVYATVTGYHTPIPYPFLYEELLNRYISYYSNFSYTFDKKYTLTGSVRLDDSNLFGASEEYRNVPLWSIGANWKINDESFMNFATFDYLNLRATYGITGNVDKSTSPYVMADIRRDNRYNMLYAAIRNPANPELRWERTSTTNIGLDYSLLGKEWSGSIEYYYRKSSDLLGVVSANSTTGFSQAKLNNASLINRGVDLELSYRFKREKFSWTSSLLYSYNYNKVTDVEMNDETARGLLKDQPVADKPLNYLYSYRWAGLSQSGTPQVYDADNNIIDHTKQLTDGKALEYNGSLIPLHYGSWSNTFAYKGFTLSAMFVYSLGHKYRTPTIDYLSMFKDTPYRVHSDYESRWQASGDEAKTNIPKMPDNTEITHFYDEYAIYGNHQVKDASNIRLQELILSYSFKKELVKKLRLNSLDIGIQGRNLALFKFEKSEYDPDYTFQGTAIRFSPQPEFSFSIRTSF